MPKFTNYWYGYSKNDLFPTLEKGTAMPEDCKSTYADASRTSNVGLGLVRAVCQLLTGDVALGREGDSFSVRYTSNNGSKTRIATSYLHPNAPSPLRLWEGADAMTAPVALCIIEAMLLETTGQGSDSQLAEVKERYEAFLDECYLVLSEPAPYTQDQLREAAQEELCQRAMMALTDGIYFAVKRSDDKGLREYDGGSGEELPDLPDEDYRRLFGLPENAAEAQALPAGYLSTTLSGLLATGGTCLLVGPTGTFKTTTATRAANEAGAALQVVKGRPGIEDRDFFGGVVPTENGPTWVDGPVTQAFRSGREEPTMLLMDELLRFEPLFLGAFVGLLDPASPAELAARSIEPASGCESEPHYVAELPNGEAVACPTSRLTLVATTNMGRDYVQSTDLDAALMGRFELTMEVEKPDQRVKRMLYEQEGGTKVADLLEAIENAVADCLIDDGGLYVRKAHPRLMLNMARHMQRILDTQGLTNDKEVAAEEAARVTVVPNCVAREANGLLDPAGKESLLKEVYDCASTIL